MRKTVSAKAGILFPVQKIRTQLSKGNYAKHIGKKAAIYMAAVLEYLCAEIFEIARIETRKANKQRIIPRHILLAIKKDADFEQLLKDVIISEAGVFPTVVLESKPTESRKSSQEY